jgi:hypothetical protein
MKTLFSDKVMAKLNKLPKQVWILLFACTIFFSKWSEIFADSGSVAQELIDMYAESGVSMNLSGTVVVLIIGVTLLYTLIYELFGKWICRTLITRFSLKLNVDDFMLRLRIVLGLSFILIGLVSITSLISDDIAYLASSIFNFAIITFLLGWFYSDFRKRFVPSYNQAKLYNYVAKIYFGIAIIFSGYNFILYMFMYDVDLTTIETIALAVDLVIKIALAGLAYFYSTKLKACESGEEIKFTFRKDDMDPFKVHDGNVEEKKDDTVFKDFDL